MIYLERKFIIFFNDMFSREFIWIKWQCLFIRCFFSRNPT
jgi:hypothetical protein